MELKDLLLFHAINFQPIHGYEASEGAWGTEGQDTWCVQWPEETQVPPGSPSRDHLSESQKDLIYQTTPPTPTCPCTALKPAHPGSATQKPGTGKNIKSERERGVEMSGTDPSLSRYGA